MKSIFATLLAAASFAAAPASVMAITPENSAYCGPGGPEAYNRPGGFCDEVGNLKSLAPKLDGEDCNYYKLGTSMLDGERLEVADNCRPVVTCKVVSEGQSEFMVLTGRVHVAMEPVQLC